MSSPSPEPRKAKARRTRRQTAFLFAGVAFGLVVALVLALLIGGRFAVLSPAGRDLVVGFVSGTSIGRYGQINVEGLSGDLWDDFSLERVTVSDEEGVWLEISNLRVDWSYWALIARRFQASDIEAERIRVIRRPVVEPPEPDAPSGAMPLSIFIDRFAARLDLEEGFSQEYGRWSLQGATRIGRVGVKSASVSAFSLTRRGDFLHGDVQWGDGLGDLRVNALAQEANGGPLAGALGYSPDAPFYAVIRFDDEVAHARVRTGQFTPLVVQGGFTGEQGARVSGYADFSGSDLLEPFVRRIGRTARFGLATVPDSRRDGFEAMSWVLDAENFTSRASGYIRNADRSAPDGVRLSLATPSLSRLTGADLAGPAAYVGVFTGDAAVWRLRGAVSLRDVNAASWRADRVSGPLNLDVNEARMVLDGDLRGQGGSRAGMIGGLLGAQPRVQLTSERAADGEILIRNLDVAGQGLSVRGSGGRNLTGGLRFNGQAHITNAGLIQPGARGAFGGPIRASKAEDGPWRMTFDGRGRGLATGMGELDRLLGATPRLQLAGSFDDGAVAVQRAELTGAAGRAGARGRMEGDGRLRLALDWRAQGPFGVGPVEIDGGMTGDGAITGTLSQPRADLTAAFDVISAGPLVLTGADLILSFRRGANASDGRIVLTSGSNYGPARASGDFFLTDGGVRLSDVDLDAGGVAARGDVALVNGAPASADLTFTARQGAFLASGQADGRVRLTEGAGADTAILDVSGRNVRFAGSGYLIRTFDLNGRGDLSRLPFTLNADVAGDTPVQFNGSGVYARQNGGAQSLTLSGAGSVRDIAFDTRSPAVVALAGEGRVARLDLNVGGGVLVGELRQDDQAALIEANLTSVEVGSISPDLRGRVTGQVSLRGAGPDLSGSANLTLAGLRSVDAAEGVAVDGVFNARLDGDVLRLEATAADEGVVQASAQLALPVETSAAPLRLAVARTRPMTGDISLQGQIEPIWDVFLGGDQRLAGQVAGRAAIAGTLNEPRLTGTLDVRQGAFRDALSGVRLDALTLAARFDGTAAEVTAFSANDGSGGTVSGGGRMNLAQGSASSFTLNLDDFRLIDNEIATADASGPITVTRAEDGNIQLMGRLDIDSAEIAANPISGNGIVRMDVIEVNRPGGDPVIAEAGTDDADEQNRGPSIGLDINLRSPHGQVWVRGRGLNVEMNVNARVRGTLANPQLTGAARVVRGDYEFAGKRFVFDDRGEVILSTDPARIRLDLRAVREDPALTAEVVVGGTAASPEITLSSTPELPQDEILSQVLFGRSASQLSAFEAAQLASGVASLAGGGGFDVLGNLREFAGLDRLSFGGDASALTVAGGRYLTDNVYFEVIGGGEGGGAVQVEWQVRRNIAVTSRFEGDGDTRLAVRWRTQSRQPGTGRRDRRPNQAE